MVYVRSARLRKLVWRLEALAVGIAYVLARLLPLEAASAFGGWVLRGLGPFSRAHRTAHANMRLAFPDMGAAERRALVARYWDNLGRTVFEFAQMDRITYASGRIEVVGVERIFDIDKSGRPAIFISGHFANWEVMVMALLQGGIDPLVTYRTTNNPYVGALIKETRARYGVRLFAPKGLESMRPLILALREGRSVATLADQKYHSGVAAPWFGRMVKTNPLAVRLAMQFNAVLQPASVERLDGVRFRCTLYPPIELQQTNDKAADIQAGVAAINAFMEARIRERPGEWLWGHRRFEPEAYAELDAPEGRT